jgi:hypothetical protein
VGFLFTATRFLAHHFIKFAGPHTHTGVMTERFTVRYQTYNLGRLRFRTDGTLVSIETTPVLSSSSRVNFNSEYKFRNSGISRDESQSCAPHFCLLDAVQIPKYWEDAMNSKTTNFVNQSICNYINHRRSHLKFQRWLSLMSISTDINFTLNWIAGVTGNG